MFPRKLGTGGACAPRPIAGTAGVLLTGSRHYRCARLFSCPAAIRGAGLQFLSVTGRN